MPGAHEHVEHAEEAEHIAGSNKKIALLISVLALFLAFAETLGKSAQTEGLRANIEAANLWAFYQAKHMRETTLRTAAEIMELDLPSTSDPDAKAAKQKRIAGWQKTADRYQSDPEKHEGRKELEEKARDKEKERDVAFAEYHHYEIASAALQIGIVLASASVITSMVVLAWLGGALGVIGVALMAIGYYAPNALHGLHFI
ncbi:MAG TPA: DUF4337 domain-containing protein [Xanthobacteraceae bacterium]